MAKEPWTKGCEWPLEAGNVKEIDSPLESPGKNAIDLRAITAMSDFKSTEL